MALKGYEFANDPDGNKPAPVSDDIFDYWMNR
jgi:hypothetical protein